MINMIKITRQKEGEIEKARDKMIKSALERIWSLSIQNLNHTFPCSPRNTATRIQIPTWMLFKYELGIIRIINQFGLVGIINQEKLFEQ